MFLRAARLLSLLALIGALSATPLTAFAQESAEEAAQQEAAQEPGLPTVPNALRQAMMSGDTRAALRELDALERRNASQADAWLYLRARVLADDDQTGPAIRVLERIEAEFATGDWVHKSRFLRADLLLAEARFAEAEAIYEEEAQRLLSRERQSELAEVYLRFARLLSTPRDPNRPGQAAPDYARATVLYRKALELRTPAAQREEALWGIAQAAEAQQDWTGADAAWRSYLGSFGRSVDLAGLRVLEARYRAAQVHLNRQQTQIARYALEDLVQVIEAARGDDASELSAELREFLAASDDEVRGDVADLEGRARYLIANTHAGNAQALALRVAALERMIGAVPQHALVGQARFAIAEAYRESGRYDQARDAYADFLAWKEPGELEQDTREQNARLHRTALYQQGMMLLALGEPEASIPVFQDYVGRYPTGAEWAAAQQSMIDAEYQIGVLRRDEQAWQAAREAWSAFLAAHPLDPRARQISFDLGQLYVDEASHLERGGSEEQRTGLWRRALSEWERLARKYPNTEEASRALYESGLLLETRLRELDEAIVAYRQCRFGGYAGWARERLQEMTRQSLAVETPRVWRTDEPAKVIAQVRNTEELQVRIYPLDLQAYFRKHLTHQRIENLDLDLIAPERTLTIAVDDYEDYKPIRQEIELPFEGSGVWAVAVEDGERRATTLVVRSDLDMVVKSSRREFFAYVQDMRRDRPAAGVEVLVALPDPAGGAPALHVLKTDKQGIARQELPDLVERPELRVLASDDGHYASDGLSVSSLGLSQGLQPRGYIYPDRSAYRPGQRVHWRGVLREIEDGRFHFEAGTEYLTEVIDSQGRIVFEQRMPLSEFGTLHGDWLLPHAAPQGDWTVRMSRPNGASFQGRFRVQYFELQTVGVEVVFDQSVYYRGEVVRGFAEARYYYGEPVVDRTMAVMLPDGRQLTARTDADGRVAFEVPTRDFLNTRMVTVSANLQEEGVSTAASVPVSLFGYSIGVRVPTSVVLAGSSFSVDMTTTDAAGESVARELNVVVARREQNAQGGWIEEAVRRETLTTSEEGRASLAMALEDGGQYVVRARGTDRFGNPVVSEAALFVSGSDDAQKLRILVESNQLPVGADLDARIINRTDARLALLTMEGERVLGYRILELTNGVNDLRLPMEAELAPNFRLAVALMDGNRFHTAATAMELERRLQVSVVPRAQEVEPGKEAVVDLQVLDEMGRPVRGEFSLAAVDQSIFAQFGNNMGSIDGYFASDARRSAGFQTTSSCEFSYTGATEQIAAAVLAEAERLRAEESWDEAQEVLVQELQEQLGYVADGRSVRLRAGLEPSADVFFAQPTLGAEIAFDSETWNDTIGIGGGAGGRFGGRRGGGVARKAQIDALYGNFGEDFVAGEEARWANEGLAFWTPAVVTDAEGRAEVRFTMPDRSTEWRLMARGVGEQDHFGQGQASLISRAPFFVELRTPRALTEGDRPTLLARVHNLTDQPGTANLRLRLLNEGFARSFPAEVEVGANAQVEVAFPLETAVPLLDELLITLEATAAIGEQDLTARADALVPVRPWGMEVADFAAGVLRSETTVDLVLPEGIDLRDRVLELTFGSDLADLVIDAALDVPSLYEVRSARLMPMHAATASRLIGACGALRMIEELGVTHPRARDLRARAEALTQALVAAQRDDGGWNWSGGPQKGSEPETSARVMHALADARERGLPVAAQALDRGMQYLLQQFQATGQRANERKAMLLHALARHGRGDFGTANRLHRLRNELSPAALAYTGLALMEMERAPMAVELAQLLEARVDAQGALAVTDNKAFHRNGLEMTALGAMLMQAALPRAEATKRAIDHLLAERPWFEDRGRGLAAAVVAHWVGATQPEAGDVTIELEIDGETMQIELAKGEFNGFSHSGLEADRVRLRLAVQGRSRPYFQATLRAFTRELVQQGKPEFQFSRQLFEAEQPLYAGRRIQTGFGVVDRFREGWTNEVTQLQRGRSTRATINYYHNASTRREADEWPYLALHVPLPAGTSVLPDSVQGNFERFLLLDHELVVFLGQRPGSGWLRYDLIGSVPGEYRALPPRLVDLADPSRVAIGEARDLAVLPRDRASTDEYRETPDELYHLGMAALEEDDEELAYTMLTRLYAEFGEYLRDDRLAAAAGKLLFLAIDRGTPREVVRYFEVLKEKNPALNIPFGEVLSVGRAYRELEEFERAMLIFRATIEESFGKDLKVAGTLEEQAEPAGSLGVLERLWLEYPDQPVVVETCLTLSDKLLTLAPVAHQNAGLRASGLTRAALTKAGVALLQRFLAMYHDDPLAPEAGLNLVTAFLDLEDFETGVTLAQEMGERFEKPRFRDAFGYSEAVGQWYLGKEDAAIKRLRAIVDARYTQPDGTDRPSENRELALYILAQIHHARRKFDEAADYYTQVENVFADAREVLSGFRAKHIVLDEVTEVRPGRAAELELRYRNIEEAELLVYRVDLMTLYLRERNLSQITSVNLAGIAPTLRKSVRLDPETGMREASKEVKLDLDDAGAYLVICRGDELHTSGLVLVSDIELEIEEDLGAGRMRVQALNKRGDGFLRDVDVRVVGSSGGDFVTGRTDPRGMFVAEGFRGSPTVIARHGEDHYAFHRSAPISVPVPPTPQAPTAPTQSVEGLHQLEAGDYLDNVFRFNEAQQQMRAKRYQENVLRDRNGVSVGQTRSK